MAAAIRGISITRSGGHYGGAPRLDSRCLATTAHPRNGIAAVAWKDVSRRT